VSNTSALTSSGFVLSSPSSSPARLSWFLMASAPFMVCKHGNCSFSPV
jgi:hypothetical protein